MKKGFSLILAVLAFGLLAVSCRTSVRQDSCADYQMSYTVADVTFEMVKLPAGNFTMGISSDNRRKVMGGDAQAVALDGFVISATPVSKGLWTAVMGRDPSPKADPSAPVDMVSWNDALKFISKLNKKTGKTFLLPTEAQWEYAQKSLAQNDFNSVAEWCSDSYEDAAGGYLKPMELMVNPQGPAESDKKVVRTALERMAVDSHTRRAFVGFRLVQPTEDTLTAAVLGPLEGNVIDREKIDASRGGQETFKVGDAVFNMVKVKGGTFTMGFNAMDSPYPAFSVPENEKAHHQVTVDDFEIGETEVTVGLWKAVMGSVPYLNDAGDAGKAVGNVSWYNSQTFLRKLSELTGRKFRLPTEAEWEYAARGGSLSRHYGFSGGNSMQSVMWFLDNSDMKVQNVGTKKANELGIYDMSGNVWEWCYDRYSEYSSAAQVNPSGAREGGERVLRGGSCSSRWEACRIGNRSKIPAGNIKGTFGLRLAL